MSAPAGASPRAVYKPVVLPEALCRAARVKRLFNAEMAAEHRQLRPWLPPSCAATLDIGCGVAASDVLLFRHRGRRADLHCCLPDKTAVSEHVYCFCHPTAAFCNSLAVATGPLVRNGLPRASIHPVEVCDQWLAQVPGGLELVISPLSWGLHYLVGTYLEQVYGLLAPGGRLILGIRPGIGAEDELRSVFGRLTVIAATAAKARVLALK